MKHISILIYLSFITLSCQKKDEDKQSYISSYTMDINGQTKAPNYSLIEIIHDSIFYRDLYNAQDLKFLGKTENKKTTFTLNDLTFNFSDEILEVSNKKIKSIYRLLKNNNGIANIDPSYFTGKKFILNSDKIKDTLFFINSNKYKNILDNHSNRWSLVDVDDYKILWIHYGFEEVPLFIQSIENEKITTHLYALKKETIILKEFKN